MTGKPLDLRGKVFGEFTTLEPVLGSVDKKRRWLCRCSCGNEESIETFQLTSGARTKCKHKQNHLSISVGYKVGKLTINKFFKKSKRGRWYAECSCSCGGIKITSTKDIQRGASWHCGCEKPRRKLKQPAEVSLTNRVISNYRRSAETKGHVCSISNDHFIELFKGNCYLCGKAPSGRYKTKNYNEEFVYSGIDRVDSYEGYTVSNVKSCCSECNYLKSNKDLKTFLSHIRRIYENCRVG